MSSISFSVCLSTSMCALSRMPAVPPLCFSKLPAPSRPSLPPPSRSAQRGFCHSGRSGSGPATTTLSTPPPRPRREREIHTKVDDFDRTDSPPPSLCSQGAPRGLQPEIPYNLCPTVWHSSAKVLFAPDHPVFLCEQSTHSTHSHSAAAAYVA